MQKEPYALPAHHIMRCTRYVTSASTTKATAWQVIWIMWQEGFTRALTELEIKRAAALSDTSWKRYGEDIMVILTEVIPLYHKFYKKRDSIVKKKSNQARIAQLKSMAAFRIRKRDRMSKVPMTDDSIPHPAFLPVQIPRDNWHEGMSDKDERKSIRNAQKPTDKKQFTDG